MVRWLLVLALTLTPNVAFAAYSDYGPLEEVMSARNTIAQHHHIPTTLIFSVIVEGNIAYASISSKGVESVTLHRTKTGWLVFEPKPGQYEGYHRQKEQRALHTLDSGGMLNKSAGWYPEGAYGPSADVSNICGGAQILVRNYFGGPDMDVKNIVVVGDYAYAGITTGADVYHVAFHRSANGWHTPFALGESFPKSSSLSNVGVPEGIASAILRHLRAIYRTPPAKRNASCYSR